MEIRLNRDEFLAELVTDAGHRRAADHHSRALSPTALRARRSLHARRHRSRRLAHLVGRGRGQARRRHRGGRRRSSSRSSALSKASEVKLVLDDRALTITAGTSRFKIHGLPAADFPTLPDGRASKRGRDSVRAPPPDGLEGALRRVERGVALPVQRRAAQAEKEGARAGRHRRPPPGAGRGPRSRASRKAMACWCRARPCRSCSASRATATLAFRRGEHHLSFRFGRRELICRILEGTFPDYERVIAKDNDKKAIFDRLALADAVAARGADDRRPDARRAARTSRDGSLTVSTANPDLGEAVEEAACEYTGRRAQAGHQSGLPAISFSPRSRPRRCGST